MNILQILPELNVGGVETGTVDLAKYLLGHGHKAVVVSNGGSLVADLEKCGAKHYALPVHKKSLLTAFNCVGKLRRIILEEKIDIVHARSRVPAWIAFLACRKTPAHFLTTCHGYYSLNFFSRVMGWPKIIIVPSQIIFKHMAEDFGVNPAHIRVIPRSVDLDKFKMAREEKSATDPLIVSIVGRLTPIKGHGDFLQSAAIMIRRNPNVRFWIIGDSPANKTAYLKELETQAEQLGLKDYVNFLGNRKDVPQLLAKTDVLVFPSVRHEAFGRAILEAQASGVAVVATRIGGVVDIIEEDVNGLLVPPSDPQALAQATLRLLNDKSLRERLISNANKKIESQYTLEHMASATVNVYEELLNESILVIKLSSIGDVVLVTASLKALRQKYPSARIYCLVGKESRDILERCPYINGTIVFDVREEDKGWLGLWSLARRLRSYGFDKIIDFQNNQKSHLLSFLSSPRASYGYKDRKLGFLLTNAIRDDGRYRDPVAHQFQILKSLDIEASQENFLELWPSLEDRKYIKEILESEWLANVKDIVGINMAASFKWPSKNWPLESTAKLCDLLSAKNIRVVITGTEKDKSMAQELLKMVKSKPAILVGKTTISQLAALMERCSVFVTQDSAPMHVAAAMGIPFIALFGPTDSKRHLPPARRSIVFEKKPVCSPCYAPQCRIKTHDCMKEITPKEVLKQIQKLMTDSSPTKDPKTANQIGPSNGNIKERKQKLTKS